MGGYALPAETEERLVVARCLQREDDDLAGLDLLYRRYAPALVAFCERRLTAGGVGGAGDAEDAAHETILKAHRALPRFREGARLWPWLATIAANVCTDIIRSRERLESASTGEGDGEGAGGGGCELLAPEVDEDVNRRLRASIVDSALDELPERFRTPLFLREFMGWSYEEIADFSNKSIGSVRTTLMRARRAFQSRVEDVARRRGQWPLPVVVVDGWRRLRAQFRSWREGVARLGGDAAGALWRAEGVLGLGSGLQAVAVVAFVAAGTATPAMAVNVLGGEQPPNAVLNASTVAMTAELPQPELSPRSPEATPPRAPTSGPSTSSASVRPSTLAPDSNGDEPPLADPSVTIAEDDRQWTVDTEVSPPGGGSIGSNSFTGCAYRPPVGEVTCTAVDAALGAQP